MTKTQTAALGFRVKSGWAAVVLLTDTAHSPQLSDVNRIELCDPRLPETRQPYHAAMGKLETNSTKRISASGWCEAFRNRHLQYFLKAISKKDFGSGALRLWWEARSIPLRSQIRTFERMRWKRSYFGRRWSKLCRIIRFALTFFSNATLTPPSLRG
ncbi:MAG: hypothetical protein ACJ8LV_06400 [Chthoniobacterales bacterium]